MRYVGPYFRKLGQAGGKCESSSGRRLELYIRKQIGLLAQQMKATGQTFGKRLKTLPDGVTAVEIMVWRSQQIDRAIARVYALPKTAKNVVLIFDTLSGWFEYDSVTVDGFNAIFPRNTIEGTTTYGPWSSSQELAQQLGTALPCNSYADNGSSVLYNRGTMYSGRMREVVQILGGYPNKIPYSPGWCKTHGIFINQTTDEWWVVEVSASGGVKAWPLPNNGQYTTEEKITLGITIPVKPAVDLLMASNERTRVLASIGDMADFYSDAFPYYAEHGWAFNYTGDAAVAISLTLDGVDQVASVWQLDITADVSGDPVSADLTMLESAYLWAARTVAPKYPYITTCGVTLLSYDTSATTEAPDGPVNFAMDAFFTPESSVPVIIRHNLDAAGTGTTTLPTESPTSGTACGGAIWLNTGDAGEHCTSGWTRVVSETPEYDFDVIGRPTTSVQRYADTALGNIVKTELVSKDAAIYLAGNQPSTRYVYDNYYEATGTTYNNGTRQQLYNEIFFKPHWDRESVGLASKRAFTRSYGAWVERFDPAVGGTSYMTGATHAGSGSPNGYVYRYADETCGTSYTRTQLGAALHTFSLAAYPLTEWEDIAIEAIGACPDNLRHRMQGFEAGELINSHCGITGEGDAFTSTEDASTDVFVFSSITNEWKQVYHEDQYNNFDAFFDFAGDCNSGVLRFGVFFDVFTGAGVSHQYVNDDGLYVWGSADTHYPVADNPLDSFAGWFGIPIIP